MPAGAEQPVAYTYSHWRRRESLGVRGLGTVGTVLAGAGGLGTALLLLVSLPAGAAFGVMAASVIVAVTRRDRFGRSLLEKGGERMGWSRTRWRGWHLYRSGPLGVLGSGSCQLPGLAASIEAYEAEDSLGQPFVVLWHPTTRHVTTVVRAHPDGLGLVDQETVDRQVAQLGQLLNVFGSEAGLVGASVTVEASPDPGHRLRKEIESVRAGDVPVLADRVMTTLATRPRRGVSQTAAWVTLTWSARTLAGRERALDEVTMEMGSRLPNLRAQMQQTGAGVCRSMRAGELAAVMRCAYDPDVAGTIEEVGHADAGVDWAHCGPLEAEEHVGFYTHDGWTSATWEMGVAPRGQVRETVLRELLQPHPKLPVKRVTMLYRPYDIGQTAKRVDSDVNVALSNLSSRRGRVRARDQQNVAAAQRAAEEEAAGAGLTRFGMVVTVSVPGADPAARREVEAVVDMLGHSARIQLRKPRYSQASAFAAGLPLGLVLPAHSNVSQVLREMQ